MPARIAIAPQLLFWQSAAIETWGTMATLEAIQNKIAALQAKADAIASKETAKAVAQIRDIMDKYGLTIANVKVPWWQASRPGRRQAVASQRCKQKQRKAAAKVL